MEKTLEERVAELEDAFFNMAKFVADKSKAMSENIKVQSEQHKDWMKKTEKINEELNAVLSMAKKAVEQSEKKVEPS